jgi:hypothetical protein
MKEMANDEQYTPAWIFNVLGVRFDLDVCAPIGGTGLVPADRHYSLVDDGLASPWLGRVWMNPPYSKPTPWVDKFIAHDNGIALLPMSKSKWFNKLWDSVDAIIPMPVNLKFEQKDGTKSPIFMPCVLVSMGEQNVRALHHFEGRVR